MSQQRPWLPSLAIAIALTVVALALCVANGTITWNSLISFSGSAATFTSHLQFGGLFKKRKKTLSQIPRDKILIQRKIHPEFIVAALMPAVLWR